MSIRKKQENWFKGQFSFNSCEDLFRVFNKVYRIVMLRTKPSCIIYVKKGPLSHKYVIYFDNIFILITKGPLQYGQNLRFVIKVFLHFTQIYRKNRSCVFVGINFIVLTSFEK